MGFDFPAAVQLITLGEAVLLTARTRDVSTTGLGLLCDAPLPADDLWMGDPWSQDEPKDGEA